MTEHTPPRLSVKQEATLLLLFGLVMVVSPAAAIIIVPGLVPTWMPTLLIVAWLVWFVKWAASGGIPPRL
jgi:hypothetical protein